MIPSFLDRISVAIRLGDIPLPDPGDVFLARMESRILLIRSIQKRFDGIMTSIVACELEPTSCHAIEGTVVDEILDKSDHSHFNLDFFNTLTPLGSIQVEAYSESKIITTGILDNPDSLRMIPSIFYKILIYFMSHEMNDQELSR